MTDAELLQRFAETQDLKALRALIDRHGGMVIGTAQRVTRSRHDAEDIAQTVFIELAREPGRVKTNVGGFLHTLATRRAIDLVRSRRVRLMKEAAAARSVTEPDASADAMWNSIAGDLDAALADLSEEDREPIVQHFLLGRTQQSVADELGVDQSTIARRLARGLERLRTRLGGAAGVSIEAGLLTSALQRHAFQPTPPRWANHVMAKAVAEAGLGPTLGGGMGMILMKKVLFTIAGVLVLAALVASPFAIKRRPQANALPATTRAATDLAAVEPTDAEIKAFFKAVGKDDQAAVREQLAALPKLVFTHYGKQMPTALHTVRSLAMAELLIAAGADPNARDHAFNARPVRWLLSELEFPQVDYLESLAGPDDDLAYALARGDLAKVKTELATDPTIVRQKLPDPVIGENCPPLHIAAKFNHPEICALLLDNGADLSAPGDWFKAPALEYAGYRGSTDALKLLIRRGANVNQLIKTDQGTHTTIWWAAVTGRTEAVRALLEAGATVDPKLIKLVRQSAVTPYPAVKPPPKEAYNDVALMLTEALRKAASQPAMEGVNP